MIIEWQTNVAGFAGNHTYWGFPWVWQSRISVTSAAVVVVGPKKHRGFTQNIGKGVG